MLRFIIKKVYIIKIIYFSFFLLLLFLLFLTIFFYPNNKSNLSAARHSRENQPLSFSNEKLLKDNISTSSLTVCPGKTEITSVLGDSMSPFIKSGEDIKIINGYYDCHQVLRNDVVVYRFAGNDLPIIKFVKALPGDTWSLREQGEYYQIIVNRQALKNADGQIYQISKNRADMLLLYVKSYPVIPSDTYLLLGNLNNGTLDSTRFGLAPLKNIVGKAEKINKNDK